MGIRWESIKKINVGNRFLKGWQGNKKKNPTQNSSFPINENGIKLCKKKKYVCAWVVYFGKFKAFPPTVILGNGWIVLTKMS